MSLVIYAIDQTSSMCYLKKKLLLELNKVLLINKNNSDHVNIFFFSDEENYKSYLVEKKTPYKNKLYNNLAYFFDLIFGKKNILISAHGNSIRAMIKLFENIDDESIDKLEVPTGEPIFYKYQSKKLLRN